MLWKIGFRHDSICSLKCDNAKEYTDSGTMNNFSEEQGILIDPVAAYSPELNGLAERINKTVIERTRAMVFDANIAFKMWALCCYYSCVST